MSNQDTPPPYEQELREKSEPKENVRWCHCDVGAQ